MIGEKVKEKEWKKTIEGKIKYHVVLFVAIALAILAVLSMLVNFICTRIIVHEAMAQLTQEAGNKLHSHYVLTLAINGMIILVICVVLTTIASGLAHNLARALGIPIKLCTERLQLLARGDLHSPVPEINREDENKLLADATGEIVATTRTIIEDIYYVMDAMGDGNFAVHTNARESFVGDFAAILDSERKIAKKLSETVTGIQQAATQVTAGSSQLSESAQNLAEGATDQASSVEELLATVTDVTDRVVKSSEEASAVGKNAEKMGEEAKESTRQMERMREAMQRISEKSAQISGVIESIEAIAD